MSIGWRRGHIEARMAREGRKDCRTALHISRTPLACRFRFCIKTPRSLPNSTLQVNFLYMRVTWNFYFVYCIWRTWLWCSKRFCYGDELIVGVISRSLKPQRSRNDSVPNARNVEAIMCQFWAAEYKNSNNLAGEGSEYRVGIGSPEKFGGYAAAAQTLAGDFRVWNPRCWAKALNTE